MENTNNISEFSIKVISVNKMAKGNLNRQRCISINENTENDISSIPKRLSMKKKMKHNISSTSISVINTVRYKVSIVFVVCCIIGCCLVPIILYNVSQTRDNGTSDPGYSHEKNVSIAKVC